MADTQRTVAALLTLFADNTSGEISAQDLRDFVVSVNLSHGGMYLSSTAETSISTVSSGGLTGDNYVKAAGTTTISGVEQRFDMPQSNRIRYTGDTTVDVFASVTVGMTAAGNNKVFGFKIAKNGTPIDASYVPRSVGTGTDVGALPLQVATTMGTNDYLELFVGNETDATNVTVESMNFYVKTLFD
jgi:hypothetical protein